MAQLLLIRSELDTQKNLGMMFSIVEYDVFLLVTQAYSDKVKKIRVLPTGVEPMTFRLVLQMLYH